MIERLAVTLSSAWVEAGVVKQSDVPLYRYGLELLLSTLANVLIIIVISIASGHTWAFVPYLLSFIPIRSFAGGYHAKTHWLCILLSTGVFLLSVAGMPLLFGKSSAVFCVSVGIISFVTIYLLSPVPARNKTLTSEEARRYRLISLGMGGMLLVLCIVFGGMGTTDRLAIKMLYCGELVAMFLLIGGFQSNKRAKK